MIHETVMKSSVVVLYYRQPYDEVITDKQVFFKQNEKPNGVIQMLKNFFSSVTQTGGVWIATSQMTDKEVIPLREEISLESGGQCTLRRVPISKEEVNEFYYNSCKEGFWPILHSFPEKFDCDKVNWETFEAVNQRFAQAACEEADDDAIIWIHDYNLWLAPYYIRQEKPNSRIAFFFHTNFPAPDIFNMLPWRKQIIESLLCCNLINFDIPRYVENFVATAKSNVKAQVLKRERVEKRFSRQGLPLSEPLITKQLFYKGSATLLDAFPEGTNYKLIKKVLLDAVTKKRINDIRALKNNAKLIFAAARADYIKGTLELLRCYERLLSRKGDLIGNVVLVVVSVHPGQIGAYQSLQMEINFLVSEVNKQFSTPDWKPIVFSEEPLSFEEMLAWFSASDIMWVPSLRDGMNIISKEFIAAKEGVEGVLILSEFAGAAVELHEAVMTNPYSSVSMDEAIDRALAMPAREQRYRMNRMFKKIMLSDIDIWSQQLNTLESLKQEAASQ